MLGEVLLGSLVAVALVLWLVTSLHLDLHAAAPPKLLRPPKIPLPDLPAQGIGEAQSSPPSSPQPNPRRTVPDHHILGLSDEDFRSSGIDAMMARYKFPSADVANCDADFGDLYRDC